MTIPHGSVTVLVRRAEAGDEVAFDQLLTRYMPRLLDLARGFQLARRSALASASDYVNIACTKLWCGVVRSRLETIDNRDNLWQLLTRMTKNEMVNHGRFERATKRGGGNVINASDVPAGAMESAAPVRQMALSVKPRMATARQDALQTSDSDTSLYPGPGHDLGCMEILESLPLDLQEIATLALFGERTEEIAATIGCADRTVQRKLRLIREYLSQ